MRIAQRIQRSLVRIGVVTVEGWEIASDYRPARLIGGDFFDAFPILDDDPGRRMGLVMADVSGKGISAALMMAFVRPIIRAALDRTGHPAEALERVNRILVDERRTGMFVTVLCAVLDLDSGRISFANAGHEMPLLVPGDGTPPRWIPGGGPLLGVFGRLDLVTSELELRPEDRLVMYTDGVTDAAAPDGGRYGDARLLRTVSGLSAGPAKAVCHAVISGVEQFQGPAQPADDIALLVVRRLPR